MEEPLLDLLLGYIRRVWFNQLSYIKFLRRRTSLVSSCINYGLYENLNLVGRWGITNTDINKKLFFIASLLIYCVNSKAASNSFYPQNVFVKPYQDLKIPKDLKKDELIKAINKVRTLKDITYVDLGDYTDFMHGHVLYKFKDGYEKIEIKGKLKDLRKDSYIWDSLEHVGIVFHTQEYRHLRKKEGFVGKHGELDPLTRNWLYFFKDTKYGRPGDLIDANIVDKFVDMHKERRRTVYAHSLNEDVFGANFEFMSVAVYFFKIKCDERHTNDKTSNVFEVSEDGLKVCLAFQSGFCRHNNCRDGDRLAHQSKYR